MIVQGKTGLLQLVVFNKEKGFDRLMQAFAKLDAPDWKLVIAGDGEHSVIFSSFSQSIENRG